jgi:hypothetical protein
MQSIFWTAQSEVANAFLVRDLICCAMRFDCRQRVGNSLPASLIGSGQGASWWYTWLSLNPTRHGTPRDVVTEGYIRPSLLARASSEKARVHRGS